MPVLIFLEPYSHFKVYPEGTMQLTVGDLAATAGVTPQAIRYYEAEGLLPEPPRTAAGYRVYDAFALNRLNFIRRARTLGLSLAEIREIGRLADSGRAPCCRVRELLGGKLHELDRKIEELMALRGQLGRFVKKISAMPDQADSSDAVCYLIETVALEASDGGEKVRRGRKRKTGKGR